jgi:hypothetical protein
VGEWAAVPAAAAAALARICLLLLWAFVATPVRVCSWFIVVMVWWKAREE